MNDTNKVVKGDLSMLTITFKDLPQEKLLHHPSAAFKHLLMSEWFDSDLVKQMVKDIDKTEVINCNTLQSPIFGQIPPERLSTGVKGLIMMSCDDTARSYYFISSRYGQNCFKWIFYISTLFDIKLMGNSFFYVPINDLPTDREYKVYFEDYDYTSTELIDIDNKIGIWG